MERQKLTPLLGLRSQTTITEEGDRMTGPAVITLNVPRAWWFTPNDRLHVMDVAARKSQIRQAASWLAGALHRHLPGPVAVQAEVSWPRNRVDADNASLVVKSMIDGCVDAGLIPGDSPEIVHQVTYRAAGKSTVPGQFTIRLTFEEVPA